MEEIIFASGSVPVAVAARVYGKDASWIRAGIVSGWLPIGKAIFMLVMSASSAECITIILK